MLRAAESLGYVPNGSARHLRRASTGTIGLHVPEVLPHSSYYMAFVFGVVERAAEQDYDVTLITSGRGRTPRVDGLVLGDPLSGDPVVERLMSCGLPVVTCERYTGESQPDGVVWSEHVTAVGALLDHVREQGASNPALIVGGDQSDWAASTHRGYREWCVRNGAPVRVRQVPFDAYPDVVLPAVRDLLTPDVDALICVPNSAASTALPVIRKSGRVVGEDLLLASCVDGPDTRAADPPITAIDLRPRAAGAACADLLFEVLGGAVSVPCERIHPVKLHVRASTGRAS